MRPFSPLAPAAPARRNEAAEKALREAHDYLTAMSARHQSATVAHSSEVRGARGRVPSSS